MPIQDRIGHTICTPRLLGAEGVETGGPMPYSPPAMIHENLPAAIEDLSSRIIAIRDSL